MSQNKKAVITMLVVVIGGSVSALIGLALGASSVPIILVAGIVSGIMVLRMWQR